jgi:hypothetical protein
MGEIPASPSSAQTAARRVRSWLKKLDLSPDLRRDLEEQESLLISRAEDRQAQIAEVEGAIEATLAAEATHGPGIYVYTLPHYLRHPYDPATGRTLLKVGHSGVDAHYRANSQGRLTALPEDPILLRIYPVAKSAKAERDFTPGYGTPTMQVGGPGAAVPEWFVTSTKFLDRIARSMGLEVVVVADVDAGDDQRARIMESGCWAHRRKRSSRPAPRRGLHSARLETLVPPGSRPARCVRAGHDRVPGAGRAVHGIAPLVNRRQNVAIGLTGLPDVPAKRTGATARWKSHWPSSAAVIAHTSRSQLSSSHRPIATRLTA